MHGFPLRRIQWEQPARTQGECGMREMGWIVCCTQNEALQLMRQLRRCGISGTVTRPAHRRHKSCSWAVQIARGQREQAAACLRTELIKWEWME